jgi:ADP-heptose:LPS heptosyltransferase
VRILIVQTAFLGDVVLTLPLIEAVQQRFPNACVEVLTVPAHAPVLQGQSGVHAVIPYDKRGAQRGIRRHRASVAGTGLCTGLVTASFAALSPVAGLQWYSAADWF